MDEDLIVSTSQGKLYGIKTTTILFKKACYSFCGIPYAKPPIDGLRFMPPEPAGKWRGLLNATKERSDCIHYSHFIKEILGSEDCLYLNVHTPEPPRKIKDPKAVIVLIHPGGNSWGSGSRESLGNPDFIVSHDVVVVAINYRLHALGFLDLGIPQCNGNMGLKDQVLAFKWVRNNIKCFGGDPNNITLAGSSSAACDVHFHMMSPLSQGLFHKVILQCGYALNGSWGYMTREESLRRAFMLGHELDFRGNRARTLLSFLKTQNAYNITEAINKVLRYLKRENPERYEAILFGPTFGNDFLPESPRKLLYTVKPIPMLCSIAEKEGLLAFSAKPFVVCKNNLPRVIADALIPYKMDDSTCQYVTKEVRSFYYNNKDINEDLIEDVVNMYTDMWYCEWYDMLDYMATQPSAQPVYLYQFTFFGEFNYQRIGFAQNAPETFIGACHADDTSYFTYYKIMSQNRSNIGVKESKVVRNLSALLTNFAKTGNPNGGTLEKIHWKPYHPNHPCYLRVDENLETFDGKINENRVEFWRNLLAYIKKKEE